MAPRHRTIGLANLVAPAPSARHDWLGRFGRFFRRPTKPIILDDLPSHSKSRNRKIRAAPDYMLFDYPTTDQPIKRINEPMPRSRSATAELHPRAEFARLRANRLAPLQSVDPLKPGKFKRSRRLVGRVRVYARPSFALLDRAFPGPQGKPRRKRHSATTHNPHTHQQP